MKTAKKFLKRLLPFVLVGIIVYNIGSVILSQSSKYLAQNYRQTFPQLKKAYLDSQYVNKNPKGWIPDEAVNSYAGGAYVQGVSPILIAPDTPPLGRYIIGFSGIVFNNVNIQNLFFVIGSLIMLYKVGQQVFGNRLLSLIPVFFLSFEPFFLNQINYTPLLDVMQLFFLLCSFYFFNTTFFNKNNHWQAFIIASFFLGCFIATKFYITGITIIAAWIGTLLILRKTKECIRLLITLPISIFVLLLTYVRVLFDNYSLFKFLGIQKYVFFYHKSQLIHPFSIWPLLFFNKWYVWFGDKPVISDAQWRLTWPITTSLSILSTALIFLRNTKVTVIPLILWVMAYLLFFSFGQVASRYFIILIPVMYVIAVYVVKEIFMLIVSKIKYI